MKKTLVLIAALFSIYACRAQQAFQSGYAILTDGTRVAGMILLDDAEPWYNQRHIWLKDSAEVKANSNAKAKKYNVADLKFFQVGVRIFEKVHYVDMENVQFKTFGANDHMMERLACGRINAYKYYQYPADVRIYASEEDMRVQEKKKKNDLIIGFKILSQKDGDKLQNAFDYDLQKYFEDTPDVLKKYQSGGYGNEPVGGKKGLAAKMMAMARKAAFKPQEADAIVLAFNEYNQQNPVKK